MLKPRNLITALVLIAWAAASAPATAGAATKPKPTCKRANSTTIAQNTLIRVSTRPGTDGGYTEGTDLVGCWKKTGRARSLAYAFDDDYVSSADFGLVRIRGQFVAFYSETFDVGCKAACPPDYEARRRFLSLVDIRFGTGFSTKIAERPALSRLLLDEHGAIVWPQWLSGNQIEVRVRDGAGERAVDSGAIRPESLLLTPGGRLSWMNDVTPRSILLQRRIG